MSDRFKIIDDLSQDTQSGKYLIFNIGNDYYGIGIKHVTEIIGLMHTTPVPDLPNYIKGIINLRGKIIPVVDVRLRFGLKTIEYSDRACIIIANLYNMDIGFIVDGVKEVQSIPDADIIPPPEINKLSNRFINGIGKVGEELRLLLDYRNLIGIDDVETVADTVCKDQLDQ